jgi:hypothetical protein
MSPALSQDSFLRSERTVRPPNVTDRSEYIEYTVVEKQQFVVPKLKRGAEDNNPSAYDTECNEASFVAANCMNLMPLIGFGAGIIHRS